MVVIYKLQGGNHGWSIKRGNQLFKKQVYNKLYTKSIPYFGLVFHPHSTHSSSQCVTNIWDPNSFEFYSWIVIRKGLRARKI